MRQQCASGLVALGGSGQSPQLLPVKKVLSFSPQRVFLLPGLSIYSTSLSSRVLRLLFYSVLFKFCVAALKSRPELWPPTAPVWYPGKE
ncbi:hypothetical protein E2C01_036223 [Portunus trituberculatus]|uniref:Uncharacterized protein n=1 Tax=Portunus trituberculatus TaxID=210409 RepID=A0A5B7F581_PORTR|nr:hypothetical protein [Portunus trituberculatus]